jgi:predicted transcriptional regulator
MMKMRIELSEGQSQHLRALAEKRNTSVSEVMRRAISLAIFFDGEVEQGNKVLIKENSSDRFSQVVLFNVD